MLPDVENENKFSPTPESPLWRKLPLLASSLAHSWAESFRVLLGLSAGALWFARWVLCWETAAFWKAA